VAAAYFVRVVKGGCVVLYIFEGRLFALKSKHGDGISLHLCVYITAKTIAAAIVHVHEGNVEKEWLAHVMVVNDVHSSL
jgi:hypothetical protein